MKFLLQNLVDHRNEFLRIKGLQGIQMPVYFFRHLVVVFLFLTHFPEPFLPKRRQKSLTIRFGTFG